MSAPGGGRGFLNEISRAEWCVRLVFIGHGNFSLSLKIKKSARRLEGGVWYVAQSAVHSEARLDSYTKTDRLVRGY